ncbi:MAG: MBL fold metallo-hydrolase [Clostridioides sp.]|jgi:beta-lactamase superfamily II metal-dependent hydrolase|nr:MBL fold metallo-hydrolase [Clostridioides sp.]
MKNKKFNLLLSVILTIFISGCSLADSENTGSSNQTSNSTLSSTQNLENNSQSNSENSVDKNTNTQNEIAVSNNENTISANSQDETKNNSKNVFVYFLNTGNSDSILIDDNGTFMLIDGGDNDDENLVVNFLKKHNVTKLKYLIATHNHADHLGGLDAVVKNIPVETTFVSNGSASSKTYRDFINALASKDLTPAVPLENNKFYLNNSYFEVFNTNGGNSTNNESLVLLYTNGNDKMLFTGDAEAETENEILNKLPQNIDLLKVGHHGSRTSTTSQFLNKLNPKYAVILCGKDNSYHHPHKETMDKLKAKGIEVHRSDECGDIVFESTGNGLKSDCEVIGDYAIGK